MVRELQQYMLCHHSGTTDSSMVHSNALEAIENEVVAQTVPLDASLHKLINFARTSLDLELS